MNNQIDTNNILSDVNEKGKIIINKCLLYGYEIEPVKLQYLLILIHGTMLTMYNKPLFNQSIYINNERIFIDAFENDLFKKAIRNGLLKEQITISHYEEQIINEMLEKYGNVSVNTLRELSTMRTLRELYNDNSKEKLNIIPNELIKEVFIYYTFYEYISPNKDENTFKRTLKQEYLKK